MGRLKAFLLGSLALASLGVVAPPAQASRTTSVTTSTSGDTRTVATVVTTVQRETEKDRYRRLKGRRGYRLLYPAKHRSPGDRAHKRWKQARRGGGNG